MIKRQIPKTTYPGVLNKSCVQIQGDNFIFQSFHKKITPFDWSLINLICNLFPGCEERKVVETFAISYKLFVQTVDLDSQKE